MDGKKKVPFLAESALAEDTARQKTRLVDAQSSLGAPLIAPDEERPLKQPERSNKNNHLQSNLPVGPGGGHGAALSSVDPHDLRNRPGEPVPGNSLEAGLSRITVVHLFYPSKTKAAMLVTR